MFFVTTSWDDGSVFDVKLASILKKYGAKGTFYVVKELPPKYQNIKLLSGQEIADLSHTQEIGAHTLRHPRLAEIPVERALNEMQGSKKWLESILGRSVSMFCYPYGDYKTVTTLPQQAGFKGARTTEVGHTGLPSNTAEMHTTIQIRPFPLRKIDSTKYYWRELFKPLQQYYKTYRALGVSIFAMTSWLSATKAAFDYAYTHGEVFHLWGHSWELERYGMWGDLEKLLAYIASHKDIQFVTNGELLDITESKV